MTLARVMIRIRCGCGAVVVELTDKPLLQYWCHCDDCQAVHGKAFAVSLYPAQAIVVVGAEVDVFTLRTTPRTRCRRCGTWLFAKVGDYGGVNGELLPGGWFSPEFHIQCRYAAGPIADRLPHFAGRPARFGGSDELMPW